LGGRAYAREKEKMSNIAPLVGIAMIAVGLALGAFIVVGIVAQRKADRDQSFD